MISSHDDFPIHQTSDPIVHPLTSDLNYYDRYWFSGFATSGEFMFEIAHGIYPNRQVADAALSIVRQDGMQHSVLASRRAPNDRSDTRVGPLHVEIVEPLRTLRIRVEPNESGITADLTFRARNAAVEEPPMLQKRDGRVIMQTVEEPELIRMADATHEIEWVKGTRRAAHVRLGLISSAGEKNRIELEPLLGFQMQGLGYGHPEWGHGFWKGEDALTSECWNVYETDPLEPRGLHVQQLCRAHMGNHVGVGLCEQVVFGPHAPSGFKEFLDGAS